MDEIMPKTLKRCLSVPIIKDNQTISSLATSSGIPLDPKELSLTLEESIDKMTSTTVPQRSNPPSREVSPAPVFNIFAPRARRYSASFSPLGAGTSGPRLTPRVSQLRQEECIDLSTREVNHEREVHSALQMSQSWEDLTLVAENWSCKSDELSNPLQVTLPSGISSCSSPSPTSHRAGLRLPYGLSPSPTRRTFATRRSMSPIAMRPSQLGPVKRKFELDDNSSWNVYSPPPLKKIFTESRGSSPVCQSPSSVCPSPDSGTYDGRITPKLFISKLCTNNTTNSSSCSSPMAASPFTDAGIDMQSNGSVSSPAATCSSSGSEPMSVTTYDQLSEESVSLVKKKIPPPPIDTDDATLMEATKSEVPSTDDSTTLNTYCKSKPNFLNKLPKKQSPQTFCSLKSTEKVNDNLMTVEEASPTVLIETGNPLKYEGIL